MDLGLGAARSGLDAAQMSLSVWADDLANANTTAYAQAVPVEGEDSETPVPAAAWPGLTRKGPSLLDMGTGAGLVATERTFGEGTPEMTGIPTDIDLDGPGFFAVLTPAGVAYTRDGSFSVDAQGVLVDGSGDPVLATTGQRIQVGATPAAIGTDGVVTDASGQAVGQIGVAVFPNAPGLLAVGQNRFVAGPASGAATFGAPPTGTRLLSGMLEGSGAQVAQDLVGVIDASESFDLNAKSLGQSAQLGTWAAGLG